MWNRVENARRYPAFGIIFKLSKYIFVEILGTLYSKLLHYSYYKVYKDLIEVIFIKKKRVNNIKLRSKLWSKYIIKIFKSHYIEMEYVSKKQNKMAVCISQFR